MDHQLVEFYSACVVGNLARVEQLLEIGGAAVTADPPQVWRPVITEDNVRALDNRALCAACAGGHLNIVERLFARDPASPWFQGLGAQDAQAVLGRVCNGLPAGAEYDQLLASSQTARKACSIGYWALRLACEQGDLAVVERVLARDPATPLFEGLTAEEVRGICNTPLYSACVNGHLDILKIRASLLFSEAVHPERRRFAVPGTDGGRRAGSGR